MMDARDSLSSSLEVKMQLAEMTDGPVSSWFISIPSESKFSPSPDPSYSCSWLCCCASCCP